MAELHLLERKRTGGQAFPTFAVMQRAGCTLRGCVSHLVLEYDRIFDLLREDVVFVRLGIGLACDPLVFVAVNNVHRQLLRMGLACSLDRACAGRGAIPVDFEWTRSLRSASFEMACLGRADKSIDARISF
jgi:hypothetical protein